MRNVPYESRLYKMDIKPSDLCHHYNKKKTLLFLYWTAPLSRRHWERLKMEVKDHLGITLTASECLLNIVNGNKSQHGLIGYIIRAYNMGYITSLKTKAQKS